MKIHLPAIGPDLPVHPRLRHPHTGEQLRALGLTKRGQAIWPVMGASPDDPGGDTRGTGDGGPGGEGGGEGEGDPGELGDAGKKALNAMKAERNAARKELTALKTQLDKLTPLQKLAEALGAKPDGEGDEKPDIEALTKRLTEHEAELAGERQARFRAEIAAEKGLTAAQAKRLQGATRDELAKDADDLLAAFAAGDSNGGKGSRSPRPDPSQGSRGGNPPSGREVGLAEAQKRFGKKTT